MKKTAFSLIELLVIIGIVAVLAAVVLPVESASREKAHAAEDANKLRELGLGIRQYLHDHDEIMFAAEPAPAKTWPEILEEKYAPGWPSFQSPFDLRPAALAEPAPVSYGINAQTFAAPPGGAHGSPTDGHVSDFASPSELILMSPAADSTPEIKFSRFSTVNVQILPPPAGPRLGTHAMRNLVNVLFADGHAAAVPWKDFTDSSSKPAGLRRWSPRGF